MFYNQAPRSEWGSEHRTSLTDMILGHHVGIIFALRGLLERFLPIKQINLSLGVAFKPCL